MIKSKPLFLPSAMRPSHKVIEMFLAGAEMQAAETLLKELGTVGLGTLRDLIKQDVTANYVNTQYADTLTPEEEAAGRFSAVKSVRNRLGLDLTTAMAFVDRARANRVEPAAPLTDTNSPLVTSNDA